MLEDTNFWVLVAVVIFAWIAWKPARKALLGGLDGRVEKVRSELAEAKRLREEAQALHAQYQRRQRDAMKEAEAIVAHAREEAERLRSKAAADLQATIARREAQAMARIAQAEATAMQEVRGRAIDLATLAARDLIAEKLQGAAINKSIDDAIAELPTRLN